MSAGAGFDPVATFDVLVSHAQATGLFDRVAGHEPKNAPGNGLTAAVWGDRVEPVKSSGLNSTSLRVTFTICVYSHAQVEPQDAIDPTVLGAVAALMAAYSGDFTLDSEARDIDLLGHEGVGLSARAGYIKQDGAEYRVMVITVPIIYNDVFEQAEG